MSADPSRMERSMEVERVLASHRAFLLAVASRILSGNPVEDHTASDFVQLTMVNVLRAIHEGRAPTDPRELKWFLRNRLRDEIKKVVRRKRFTQLLPHDVVDHKLKSPESVLRARLRSERIAAATQKLSDEDRRLVEWVYDEGLSYAEIARRLGCCHTLARTRCHQVLDKLKKSVKDGSTV